MVARALLLVTFCGCLWSAGCGLIPLPYATDVTGPVHGIRVCDAVTGDDIADAHATIETGMGMTDSVGVGAPQLLILPPGSAENKEPEASAGLSRKPDRTFAVPKRIVLGLVCRRYAQYNPATASITVYAPGYPRAMLQYCEGHAPQAGWSDSRSLAPGWGPPQDAMPNPAADKEMELVRCEFPEDGVLRFKLRRLTPELAEAIRLPGGHLPQPDSGVPARFVAGEQPADTLPPWQPPPPCATSN